jgi:ATP-dependent RNA helicase RhlB
VQIEEDTLKRASAMDDVTVGCFFGGVGTASRFEILERGSISLSVLPSYPGLPKMHKIDFVSLTLRR